METRARSILVGLFLLVAIAGGFVFVAWLDRTSGLTRRIVYHIAFTDTVAGLQPGAPVLFDGLRVGEVTDVRLDPEAPRRVIAVVAIAPDVAIRADTRVGMEFQGLMGTAAVALEGGTAGAERLASPAGAPALLVADPAASRSLTAMARIALDHVDRVVTENADSLKSTIGNLQTFSAALSRNSNRVDGILAGLERMTGGANPKPPPAVFDLPPPAVEPLPEASGGGQTVVAETTALLALQTQRFLLRAPNGELTRIGEAQWSDDLPKLVQVSVFRAFQSARLPAKLAEPLGAPSPGRVLRIDLAAFNLVDPAHPSAEVAYTATLLSEEGKVIAARGFSRRAPCAAVTEQDAAAALGSAFEATLGDLVRWASAQA